MPDPDETPQQVTCPACDGQMKVDSEQGKPWKRTEPDHRRRVRAGLVNPIRCKTCKGKGKVPAAN